MPKRHCAEWPVARLRPHPTVLSAENSIPCATDWPYRVSPTQFLRRQAPQKLLKCFRIARKMRAMLQPGLRSFTMKRGAGLDCGTKPHPYDAGHPAEMNFSGKIFTI